jgi:hypothetical protein
VEERGVRLPVVFPVALAGVLSLRDDSNVIGFQSDSLKCGALPTHCAFIRCKHHVVADFEWIHDLILAHNF